LGELTKSEVFSVMCSGMGSVAFSTVGAYTGAFHVDIVQLLTAMIMTAPAGLVVARLLYPETEKSKFATTDKLQMDKGTDRNIVEAAAMGASCSIPLVANIAANLIAFVAVIAVIDDVILLMSGYVGFEINFTDLCGYLFVPVAFLMGVPTRDCFVVGKLVGVKTMVNEFVAYEQLGEYVLNRQNLTRGGFIMAERSEAIAIHALCGFCNIGSMGIIIGGLGVLMPTKKEDLANNALRALFGAMLCCFLTASVAGMMYKPAEFVDVIANNTMNNATILQNITTIMPNVTTPLTVINNITGV